MHRRHDHMAERDQRRESGSDDPAPVELLGLLLDVAADNPDAILERLRGEAARIAAAAADIAPEAAIDIEITNTYPGLDTPANSEAVAFVKSLTGANGTIKVAFGTEGGLFSRDIGTPTVVCGPGSMAQGHKPDEFVTVEQMQRCDEMLAKLLDRLVEGIAAANR